MEFEKITDAELVGKGVTGLPDVPGLSTADMQAKFDELSKDVIIPKFNTFIDSLNELIKTGIVASDDIRKIRINAEGYLEYSSDGNSFEKPQNERGSRWSEGTAITGENTEPTVFPNSGIEDALKNDQYLNSQNGNLYSCTLGGTADIAQLVYSGNIKGDTPNVADDMTVSFEQASTRNNIDSGEKTKTLFGKIKKWFADMTAAAFAQVISSNTDLMALTTSGYLPDALAVKNQFAEMDNALTVKNITSDFTNTNLISFMALKYGNEIRIFFVGDTTKDFSLVTTKWKPKFPTEYLCLNYSAWNNAAGYQGVVSRIAKTDGTIAEYKTSEGLLYAYMTPLCFIYYI